MIRELFRWSTFRILLFSTLVASIAFILSQDYLTNVLAPELVATWESLNWQQIFLGSFCVGVIGVTLTFTYLIFALNREEYQKDLFEAAQAAAEDEQNNDDYM